MIYSNERRWAGWMAQAQSVQQAIWGRWTVYLKSITWNENHSTISDGLPLGVVASLFQSVQGVLVSRALSVDDIVVVYASFSDARIYALQLSLSPSWMSFFQTLTSLFIIQPLIYKKTLSLLLRGFSDLQLLCTVIFMENLSNWCIWR